MPLIFSGTRLPWDPLVHCTDASPSGVGCVTKQFDTGLVRCAGRIHERWRFSRREESCAPRLDAAASTSRFSLPKEFAAPDWSIILLAKWSDPPKHTVEGEGRGLMFAVKHSLRSGSSFGKRHLLLSDSLTNVLASGKGRSSRDSVATSARAFAAHSLATGARFYLRWLPSEANHADGPSRGRPIDTCPSAWSGAAAELETVTYWWTAFLRRCPRPAAPCLDATLAIRRSCTAFPSPSACGSVHLPRTPAPAGTLRAQPGRLARNQARRSKRRCAQADLLVLPMGRSFLEERSVRPQTAVLYRSLVQDFLVWAMLNGLRTVRASDVDDALIAWMDEQSLEGEAAHRGSAPLAALRCVRVDLAKPGGAALPRAHLALKGWRRMAPAQSRLPLPWEPVRSGDGARVPGLAVGGAARRLHHDLLLAAKRGFPTD